MKGLLVAVAGLTLVAATALSAQDAAKVAAGKKIYDAQNCKLCHQVANVGNKMYPLDGVGAKLTAVDLKKWFTNTAEMEAKLPKKPAIKMSSKKFDLKDADLDALVAYLQSLK